MCFEDPERASDPFQNLHSFLSLVGAEIFFDSFKNLTVAVLLLEILDIGEERGILTLHQDLLGVCPLPAIDHLRYNIR